MSNQCQLNHACTAVDSNTNSNISKVNRPGGGGEVPDYEVKICAINSQNKGAKFHRS